MNEKEKLITIIQNAVGGCARNWADVIATALIESNEVIIPPCKVGDKVYMLDIIVDYDKCENCEFYYEGGMGDYPACNKGYCGNRPNECVEIKEVIVTQKDLYWWLYMDDFGKTVFLTKEEAEQALKERK